MNKKLLLTALSAALVGGMGSAQAGNLTLFGNVNVSVDSIDIDGGFDDINLASNTSSVGVKGSEDLGNNLKAIFLADFQFDAANGGDLTGRDQWVGLAGSSWGKVRFGTISTSYKSHGAMIDPLYRTSLQGRGSVNDLTSQTRLQSALHSGKGGDAHGRLTDHIRYDSPNWSGFGFTVDYALDDDDARDGDDTYGFGAHWKGAGALVFADYITTDSSDGGNSDWDDTAWKIGGKYAWNDIGFYAQYESGGLVQNRSAFVDPSDPASDITVGNEDAMMWHLGLSYTLGNTLVYFAYGEAEDLTFDPTDDYEHTAWTLAIDHKMSKRTDVYVGFNQVDMDRNDQPTFGETDFFSLGLRHKF